MADTGDASTVSPYATGGGGTVLEHRYGAVLLADLLTASAVPSLGDDVMPVRMRFQARAASPVDDFLVVGRTRDGGERRLSVGVRRAPALTASEQDSVGLLSSYLNLVVRRWDDVWSGGWRLALAVAGPNAAARQLDTLCQIARAAPDEGTFRATVAEPGRTNAGVRTRLRHIDNIVGATNIVSSGLTSGELAWRLLHSLRVIELRLEGGDESDRTQAVNRLRAATADGTIEAADAVFATLTELAGRYAPLGAEVTESTLRRDLHGTRLARSPNYAAAFAVLDDLGLRLRDRTELRLTGEGHELELPRALERQSLVDDMTLVGSGGSALIVVGEPDVGKSALATRASEDILGRGGRVTSFNLRDVPVSTTEFEHILSAPLEDVFSATATADVRVLLIDGTESVLEGRSDLLTDIATAALRAGLGVVAVTREDGSPAVREAISRALAGAGAEGPARHHPVSRLSPGERVRLAGTFASLAPLIANDRTSWLLGRPGLVDLLLRSDIRVEAHQEPMSEADIFRIFWSAVVRRNEVLGPGGATPDGRQGALIALARRLLQLDDHRADPEAASLPSLRSDGLLLTAGQTFAWLPGDQFASDLVRDMSLARLLITEGFAVLWSGGAPRWTVRAVRLACQAQLATAGADVEVTRGQLQETFDQAATQYGARWSELPLEALLTLGTARQALTAAWPGLLADRDGQLRTLLRLALQRYVELDIGDPIILAPLVELTYLGEADLGQHNSYDRQGIGSQIRKLVLAWLRGVAKANGGPNELRQRVRDQLLASGPTEHDEFAIEALGMLGPDLNEAAEQFLRDLAATGGGYLAPAVESVLDIVTLSNHQPDLLLELADSYYIERPNEEDTEFGSWRGPLDDGIRNHYRVGRGFGPSAGWYFGPFYRLLHVRLTQTVALVNRMLDHAATNRVRGLAGLSGVAVPANSDLLPGIELVLPGVGPRHCVGDDHVWSWYRGSSVGPYPCMSALLAVERWADELIERGADLGRLSDVLLRDCHNLAMPALVVGLLVRHLDQAVEHIDDWLAQPLVWHLEISRVVREGSLHIQGRDAAELVGRERRALSPQQVAAEVVLKALVAGNQDRLAALAGVGDEIVAGAAAAAVALGRPEEEERLTTEGWAALFRPQNYHARQADDGGLVLQFEPPEEIAVGLAPSQAVHATRTEAIRLLTTYGRSDDRVAPAERLIEDLKMARTLADGAGAMDFPDPLGPTAATAAAAVIAHAQGRTSISADDLQWAVATLVQAAANPEPDPFGMEESMYPMGADRSAGVALPYLLLPTFDDIADRNIVVPAIQACAESVFDEVRLSLARGLAIVWSAPCDDLAPPRRCRHRIALDAVEVGIRDCRLGDWDPAAQRRLVWPLAGPYDQTLPTVEAERLRVNRLAPPIVEAAGAALSNCCVAATARALLDALLDAHRRGYDHWAREGYGQRSDAARRSVVAVLLERAIDGDARHLTQDIRVFVRNARALDQFLGDAVVVFTYDERLRRSMTPVWRAVMETALNELANGADLLSDHQWGSRALAAIVPAPEFDLTDPDPTATFGRVSDTWVRADDISDLMERWLPMAQHESDAVDALVRLVRCQPAPWQTDTGLDWVERLVSRDYAAFARRSYYLPDWLETLRGTGLLGTDAFIRWRRLVDGLAAEGDSRAASLQRAEE